MKQFHVFGVIMSFYISLPSWPDVHTVCTVADRERFSLFRTHHWAVLSNVNSVNIMWLNMASGRKRVLKPSKRTTHPPIHKLTALYTATNDCSVIRHRRQPLRIFVIILKWTSASLLGGLQKPITILVMYKLGFRVASALL
jgi:hypothetical protein